MNVYNLVSLLGVVALPAFAWLCSSRRRAVSFRVVGWGIGLQLLFGFFVFVVPWGGRVFLFLNRVVVRLLDSATAGTRFLFGRLALPPGAVGEAGETSLGSILITQALPTIVFFAALISVLYYLRIMPVLIRLFARLFSGTMHLSGAESLCASSNIFVGVESALVVRPYLRDMTVSELTTILTAGMATIASTVLALYVTLLRDVLPTIAGHLISASVLSAPAAVVMSKLLVPETGKPKTLGRDVKPAYEREENIIMAVINGAHGGLKLLGGIVALLLAFLGLLALVDLFLGWMGGNVNQWFGWNAQWSLSSLLGLIFYPFTLLLGVPPQDATTVARLIGERTVATEVVSYQHLAGLIKTGALVHPRSAVIASYALCGFAHVASLAIFVGGAGALVPERLRDLSRTSLRALLAATLASLQTAAVAGAFVTGGSILLGR
ncbi:MAG: nucleoside transporter [Candidatus Aminicenantes bacterium]|nr:nucleoside transporter [Candidatus Aminicenantes bacterium]